MIWQQYASVAHHDFYWGEDRREYKVISGKRENGKGKITKEKQHGSQGDGLCETNKETGKGDNTAV